MLPFPWSLVVPARSRPLRATRTLTLSPTISPTHTGRPSACRAKAVRLGARAGATITASHTAVSTTAVGLTPTTPPSAGVAEVSCSWADGGRGGHDEDEHGGGPPQHQRKSRDGHRGRQLVHRVRAARPRRHDATHGQDRGEQQHQQHLAGAGPWPCGRRVRRAPRSAGRVSAPARGAAERPRAAVPRGGPGAGRRRRRGAPQSSTADRRRFPRSRSRRTRPPRATPPDTPPA